MRKRGALFPQEEEEGGPNLRVVEEGNEVQPGKRARELRARLVKQGPTAALAYDFLTFHFGACSAVKTHTLHCFGALRRVICPYTVDYLMLVALD